MLKLIKGLIVIMFPLFFSEDKFYSILFGSYDSDINNNVGILLFVFWSGAFCAGLGVGIGILLKHYTQFNNFDIGLLNWLFVSWVLQIGIAFYRWRH